MTRRAILVWFDREENSVEIDADVVADSGLSSFEVTGALSVAAELSTQELPAVQSPDPEYTDTEEE